MFTIAEIHKDNGQIADELVAERGERGRVLTVCRL
jgi:hypothetical protein